MEVSTRTSVRVAYCVVIDANENGYIDWIKTQERMERFAESYAGNEDGGDANRSAKRVRTVPPSNSLFALAAQAVTNDAKDLQAALPNTTNEDVERIRDIYPILVTRLDHELEEGDDTPYDLPEEVLLKATTSKVLNKIFGRDDHGLEFTLIGHSHGSCVFFKLILNHEIRFQDTWNEGFHGVRINVVPLSLPSVDPTVGVSMAHVLSVLGMKAVDEPGWKVVSDHYDEHF
jgi:hypothetical protein